ncbi:MAG TPA: hypothetical protein PK024_04630 [Methanospirillum sp.]|uniref:hypothetical protein n=1 Tax=Methanospirillum sp. TaxID=45200 RepID=UPI002CECC6C6|nr:hypothetical protein [Methanospirillum sp.]HOJ96110.1 hypothetical protein [Methanospirillum sp.]HPP76766.1 hypothetical protein [Methanospirillum sp.]
MVRHVYEIIQSRKSPAKIIDNHDGTEIGEVRKYELSDDGSQIIQKGIILDSERFSRRQQQGYKFVSPEIVINRDANDRIVSVDIDKLALTQNPGMIPSMYNVEKFRFSAPNEDDHIMETNTESNGWKEPIGELEKRIQSMNSKLDKIGDKLMTEQQSVQQQQPSVQNMITLTPEQLSELVKSAVSEQIKALQMSPPETEKPAEVSKSTEDDGTQEKLPQELLEKISRMEADLERYRNETKASLQSRYDALYKELRDLGIENPDELVSDSTLTLEQKISVLEGYKRTRIKHSGITSPLKEPLSGESSSPKQRQKITISDVLKKLNAENSPDLREKISKLRIFDEHGVFIG